MRNDCRDMGDASRTRVQLSLSASSSPTMLRLKPAPPFRPASFYSDAMVVDVGRPSCGAGSTAPESTGERGAVLAQLLEMGFPLAQASLAASRCGGDTGAAVEWLMSTCAESSAPASAASSRGAHSREPPMELGECPICCEALLLAAAAMRCAGRGGMRHYFHAHCLASWVRECQRTSVEPTCPQCRGPVQVRAKRLHAFLQEKLCTRAEGQRLGRADRRGD